jgi:chemosensory pili system protein ChpA (sensor histidine kinase/response regulator)
MDDVCEALLDLYGAVEEGSLPADARFFAQAQHAHEALLDMLDEVAAGQDLAPRPELVDSLRNLLDQALPPDATGLVGIDTVTPLHPDMDLADTLGLGHPSLQPGGRRAAGREAGNPGEELLEVFLEESSDIVESAAAALARWQADPRSSVEVDNPAARPAHPQGRGAHGRNRPDRRPGPRTGVSTNCWPPEFAAERACSPAAELPRPSGAHARCRAPGAAAACRHGADRLHSQFQQRGTDRQCRRQGALEAATAEVPAAAPERRRATWSRSMPSCSTTWATWPASTRSFRGRIEQQVNDAQFALNEMETTSSACATSCAPRHRNPGRISSRQQFEGDAYDDFDPLEMDRHSQLQQLSRALFESASDLLDLKETLASALRRRTALQQQARVNTSCRKA